jgi:hypothetical protein
VSEEVRALAPNGPDEDHDRREGELAGDNRVRVDVVVDQGADAGRPGEGKREGRIVYEKRFLHRPVAVMAGREAGAEEGPGAGDNRTGAVDVVNVVRSIAAEKAREVNVLGGTVSVPV